MTTIAPPNLVKVAALLPSHPGFPHDQYVMDGIVGDEEHLAKAREFGTYHISAEDCGNQFGHLYSLNTPEDIAGGKAHPTFASAWDLHWNPAGMILVTNRLIAAAKAHDPRLNAVAEIAGTTNGHTVHAYYVNTGKDDPNNTGGWDDGHLSHNHLSIRRDKCDDYAALLPILDVICGVPLHPTPPAHTKEVEMILVEVTVGMPAGVASPGVFTFDGTSLKHVEPASGKVSNVAAIEHSLGVAAPAPITYAQYKTWGGK